MVIKLRAGAQVFFANAEKTLRRSNLSVTVEQNIRIMRHEFEDYSNNLEKLIPKLQNVDLIAGLNTILVLRLV